jgi:fructose-1,6-bisphosphatase/sedoheptulose 1,7-bisphosphatase-like protein
MNKKRKSLDDSLASEFVFGGDKPEAEAVPTPDIKPEPEEVTAEAELESTNIAPMSDKPVEKQSKELSLMEKLQVEAKEGTKRFTIDLRESVHRKLSILAAKTGRSKADIVRMLLDEALEDINE